MTLALLLAALSVLSADRLAMADRLFNKGRYAEAEVEYRALENEPTIAADELLYRFAECERATGKKEPALKRYAELYGRFPDSKYAPRARFMHAMGMEGMDRKRELAALDTDRLPADVRAAALYHLGIDNSDVEMLARCEKLDPNGRYALYASLRRGTLLAASKDAAERRKGVELLLGIAFGKHGELSEEALYLASVQSYRDRHYGESASLFRRYLKSHPKGKHRDDVRVMSVWSDYMNGRYADAAAACGEERGDDFGYLRAACAYATGDDEKAISLFRKYLEEFPQGKYRGDAELPLARLEFKKAEKAGDAAMTIESAKRGFGISKLAADALRLAWAYERAGRQEEAISEYVRIARQYPGTEEAADALFRKAMMDAQEERWNGMELALAEALASGKCGKRKAEALYWRGIAAVRTGHEAEAVGFLREALEEGLGLDESREARLLVADFDFRNGKTEEARKAYSKLVSEGACERMSAARTLAVGKLLGGEEARTCARALVGNESAEWRQAGYALLGDVEDKAQAYGAAIDAYRKCLAEKANVAEVTGAALRLGMLETRNGEFDRAEETLKKAVASSGADVVARGSAYLALAANSEAKKDFRTACAYATVVTSLFDDPDLVSAAKKILAAHPEEAEQ